MPKINTVSRDKIEEAVNKSIEPSPDSARTIAEQVGEHVTLVVRVMTGMGLKRKGGRWVWRGKQDARP
jgi:hypothetical protein